MRPGDIPGEVRAGTARDAPRRTWAAGSLHPSGGSLEGHYRRIPERPFTAEERATTTLLVGNLTRKHEALIRAVFQRNGFLIESLPDPTKQSFRTGKEYCNNGLCNPVYYTAGALILHLKELEKGGLSPAQIKDQYVYFTLSDCGPCRLGTYESEYRQALRNAGFDGFRVITIQLNRASKTGGGRPGLDLSLDHWFGIVNALVVGDLLYGVAYQIRPYEVTSGETDAVLGECVDRVADFLRTRPYFGLLNLMPEALRPWLSRRRNLVHWVNGLGKYRSHFRDREYTQLLRECGERISDIEVDRKTPRAVVQIVGEFYSHLAESDANYKMFEFLEVEGAEVRVGSIGGVLRYWFFKSRRDLLQRWGLNPPFPGPPWFDLLARWRNWKAAARRPFLFYLIDRVSGRLYRRFSRVLGGFARIPHSQEELADLAGFYYRPLTRGGEGHLEVAESIHATINHEAHMALSLKPFGCMPSTQSDGVMATVSTHFDEMLFASIETTGDSDINAYSRVQLVLSDAHRRAVKELEDALQATGQTVEGIQRFSTAHPEVNRAGYRVPHHPGVVAAAANYVRHVGRLMAQERSEGGWHG
jgi:predicted nucleotide-binding protein (sugar kinase/HSP70/actin superfamily)